jgi:hypothetical protein
MVKEKQIVGYLKVNPRPSDMEVHIWAKRHGYAVDKVEEGIYRIAGKCVKKKGVGVY